LILEKKIRWENKAVAGVIEALLLIALVAIIISIIQLEYIPQIMQQREAEHMDEIANQFSQLKNIIDNQALAGSMGTDVPLARVDMTSLITLGSRKLPYFITVPAYGEIKITDAEAKIHANPSINGCISGISFSSIIYHAYNMYFVEQNYILEGGGIILKQPDGESVMRADPSISIKNMSENIEMKFYLPNIIGVDGKKYTNGYGRCFIRTNYSSYQNYPNNIINNYGNNYIIIYSCYLNAWNESLNRLFDEEIKNGYINITITRHAGIDVVKITPLNKPIILDLIVVDIYAQIGPGWII
jgi:hypothetical protein